MSTSQVQHYGSADEERLEEHLGELAMRFRGTRDQSVRQRIADDYTQTVKELISRGEWDEMPAFEDQLPDEWMPREFFDYWSRP